jgi:hypothetical protein
VGLESEAGPPAGVGKVLVTLADSIGPITGVLLPDTHPDDSGVAVIKPSSPEMPPPAERGDRYQLFGEIARGGMGAILKGRDADLGRDLAVKVLLEEHRGKPELARRFVEEAQIGGQLQHPAPGDRAGVRARDLRRPPPLLHHEAGQGPHPRRIPERTQQRTR